MQLQETEHIEQAEVQGLFRDIQAAHAVVIHTGEILPETAHITEAQQQTDRAQQEGLIAVPHNVVPDIPDPLPPCQEPQVTEVQEEVRDQEAQVIEVQGQEVQDQEVRAIEVQDQEVREEVLAIEVPVAV